MRGKPHADRTPPTNPPPPIPSYLSETYHWAYINERTVPWLDQPLVVSAILWGNARRLMRAACAEFAAGQRVLQAACVYGDFSCQLAEQIGPTGELDIVDVTAIQVRNTRIKLSNYPHAQVHQADLTEPLSRQYDGVCAFFLLHEVPEQQRRQIVDNLLAAVGEGGKAVFVDYHRPAAWHPLRPIMAGVFKYLEPYANSLLDADIARLSARGAEFEWQRETRFGGLYQHVVATRRRALNKGEAGVPTD